MNNKKYYVEARWGGGEDSPAEERLRELISELSVRDEEHPDTWMVHRDSEWSLRFDEDHFAYLENPEGETIAHLAGVTAETALDLWLNFAEGGPDAVSDFEWIKGPRPISEQEIFERNERAKQAMLELDRTFYDQLGPELSDAPCKVQGCARGCIQYSVLCKVHHFEQIRQRPSPFSD